MHSTPSLSMRKNERLTFATFICSVLAILPLSLTMLHTYVGAALIITSFVVHALVMLFRGYMIAGRRPIQFFLALTCETGRTRRIVAKGHLVLPVT